jgi:CheY-like chemotaxis protein
MLRHVGTKRNPAILRHKPNVRPILRKVQDAFTPPGQDMPATILLVEDDGCRQGFVYQLLTTDGYNVLAAGSGAEALSICRHFRDPIALLLTDVETPGMSGFELAARACRLRPVLRVLFMSSDADYAFFRGDAGGTGLLNDQEYWVGIGIHTQRGRERCIF